MVIRRRYKPLTKSSPVCPPWVCGMILALVKQFQYNSIRANKFLKVIRPNFMQMNSSKFIKETNIYLPTIEDELKKINT